MSVIDFFTNYWDWYLLIGAIIGAAGYFVVDDLNWKRWPTYLGVIVGISFMSVFWLPASIAGIKKAFTK